MTAPNDRPCCPDGDTLARFTLGKLPAATIDEVGDHISSCARCEALLRTLPQSADDDSVVNGLKKCLGRDGAVDEPAQAAMEAAARGLVVSMPGAGGAVDGQPPGPEVGRLIGRHVVLGQIGRGGMGVVYRARQVSVNRVVALKVVLAGGAASPQAVARFRTEGEAIARLRHANVVQMFEFGTDHGVPYYSMELVEGVTLASTLAEGPLDPRAAAAMACTLAAAVDFAHDRGVIHRDLKPSNILVGPDAVPKIADFGLAKLLDQHDDGLTDTDAVLGTPSYMAPEQAAGGSKGATRATDVYALGAILYECLTGRPPFKGPSKAATLGLVRTAAPVRPSRARPAVPADLEAICLKCLEKAPARRYPTAQALAEDLARWLRRERPAGVPGRYGRAGQAAWRRRRPVAAGLAVAAAVWAAAAASDTGRSLRKVQAELAGGRTTSLIGPAGAPTWSRWLAGEAHSQTAAAGDGAFAVHTWSTALLELLPDPGTERYRLAAQVRHEKSAMPGEAGVFVARQAHPAAGGDIVYLTQLVFNDVRSSAAVPVVLPGNRRPAATNAVRLYPHLYSDDGVRPHLDWRFSGAEGPRFFPAGELAGGWHDLVVCVAPDGVAAQWDGRPVRLAAAGITLSAEQVNQVRADRPAERALEEASPAFVPRGGLGLYVERGSASFRNVSVTPWGEAPQPPEL